MIVQFTDAITGTPVYINPDYVVNLRPDAAAPEEASIIKLRDGESVRVRGDHEVVARKLQPVAV